MSASPTHGVQRHIDSLWDAARLGRPTDPPTSTDPGFGVEEAYAVQAALTERRLAAGARIRGRKVGLTSAAMQAQLGVDEPDYGVLFDDMFVDDGDEIASGRLLQPRVEGEIAFVLGDDLRGPGVTVADVMRSTAGVTASIEVIDSRIADWRISLADTIADNASSGLVVLGGRLVPLQGIDLRLVGLALYRNGDLVETGAGAAVLGNPVRCVAWLANKLAGYDAHLCAGDVVLAGALHRAVEAAPGDFFRAELSRLGAVTTRFGRAQG
jgi:2-keto-4-pentenoate hydratase